MVEGLLYRVGQNVNEANDTSLSFGNPEHPLHVRVENPDTLS